MQIKRAQMIIPPSSWPDHKAGIILLATGFVDRFFASVVPEGHNSFATVVRIKPDGEIVADMSSPMSSFADPDDREAWSQYFADEMVKDNAVAGFTYFEGNHWDLPPGMDEDTARRTQKPKDGLFVMVYIRGEGLIQTRTSVFERDAAGAFKNRVETVYEGYETSLTGHMGDQFGRSGEDR